MRIDVEALRDLIDDVFVAAGCSEAESARIAANLVGANLAGHDSHGVIRTSQYVSWLEMGIQVAGQELAVVMDEGVLSLLDGQYGMGQTIGPLAVEHGMARAGEHGVAVVALRRSGHLGRIGEYAETAAAGGLVSIHFVNVAGSKLVAPFGARERRMGTNPVAIGVPRPGAEPVILDFATSIVAEGKARVAMMGGPALPEGSLVGGDGAITADPSVLYAPSEQGPDAARGAGALRAMGEHKGSGLALMCELLAGALTGGGCAGPGRVRFGNGMLSIYLDPHRLDMDGRIADDVTEYVEWFVAAQPTSGGGPVMAPGDPERMRRAERAEIGLDLPDDVWQSIVTAAHDVGVPADRIPS